MPSALTMCRSWDSLSATLWVIRFRFHKGYIMKKALTAALCSALIIPGLGQIINEQWKKGLILLGAVFVLFVMAVIAMYSLLKSGLSETSLVTLKPDTIIHKLSNQDFSALWIILGAFTVVWIYSVLDAFWMAKKRDGSTKQGQ